MTLLLALSDIGVGGTRSGPWEWAPADSCNPYLAANCTVGDDEMMGWDQASRRLPLILSRAVCC